MLVQEILEKVEDVCNTHIHTHLPPGWFDDFVFLVLLPSLIFRFNLYVLVFTNGMQIRKDML